MAIDASNLTVSLKETLTLNGQTRGFASEKNMTTISCNDVVERIVTATTTEVSLVEFSDDLTSLGSTGSLCGVFDKDLVKYIRIYNGDADSYVILTFKNSNSDEFAIKLDYGNALALFGDNTVGFASFMDASQSEIGTFTDATTDYTSGALTVTCDTSTKIKVGQALDGGSKTQAGSTVATVNTPGAVTSLTMSLAAAESGTNASTTFTGPVTANLSNITVIAEASTVDLDILIAS